MISTCTAPSQDGGDDFAIVQDGTPRATIVIAENATDSASRAAAELQGFVELISGAKLPIHSDSSPLPPGPVLLVGHSRLTADVDVPCGTDRNFTSEGFLLKRQGSTLILAGNEDGDQNGGYHGTEYAVYELLERLGCRWYFPGDFGQVIPKQNTITIPDIDVAQRPCFAVRNIWASGYADFTGELDTWLLRNKATPRCGFAFPGDGTIQQLVPLAKYAKQFPDVYAMDREGKRQDETVPEYLTMLCMSNPKGLELAAQYIVDYFHAHPEANSYGFSAPDAFSACHCPDCSKRMHDFRQDSDTLESTSDSYFNFVNNLSWAVNKTFPDKYIVSMAYLTRMMPPEGLDQPWNPNIIIQLAPYLYSTIRPIGTQSDVFALRWQRVLTAWARIAPKILIYDFDPHADLSRMPFWRSRAIASDMRIYHMSNVVGFTTEGNNTFLRTGINYYVRTRCMWDVKVDVNCLLQDFYKNFFGPAAGPMRRFCEKIEAMLRATPDHLTWHHFNQDWSSIYPAKKVEALSPYLDRAEDLADSTAYKERVQMYRILHTYMLAYLQVHKLQHQGRYSEALATLETLPQHFSAAEAIQPGFLPPDSDYVRTEGHGINHLKARLEFLHERAGGATGELLGRAPRKAQFLPDPLNVGLFEQWQRTDVGTRLKWQRISLTRSWGLKGYRDEQGYAYHGVGWYRMTIRVSKPLRGRSQLLVPLIFAEKVWIWVNGDLACSPTYMNDDPQAETTPGQVIRRNERGYISLLMDIHNQLCFNARNILVFRLEGTNDRTGHRGIAEVPFVWAPR